MMVKINHGARQIRRGTEPVREEAFLRLALGREVAPKERPQRGVDLDAVVEPIHQRVDRGTGADTNKRSPPAKGRCASGCARKRR
jgi:hypothetical protein